MRTAPRSALVPVLVLSILAPAGGSQAAPPKLPRPAEGWAIEPVVEAPAILFPTASVVGPDGTLYLGQDPMDMPGPPTEPIDSVVAVRDGKVSTFAEGLWAVMGLEWVDDALIVVHAPYLSAFRDADGDGRADRRVDLMTGLGPEVPGFSGINDHVASGLRLGMDGFLYIAVGDKGIPKGVGRDGATIQLRGGGVIRIRPDGTGLQVVSTGERNPLSVALTEADDAFTFGNDDDSKRWPNSLTHHVVGGHYGYPYEFTRAPERALPIVAGQLGGSGTQGICWTEDGLPDRYKGSLFFCDWGRQEVFRYEVEPAGATFRVVGREAIVTKGDLDDFRPFSLAVGPDRASLYLVDWAYNGWLADGLKTGRVFRLRYTGPDAARPAPAPADDLAALDHPARSVRLAAQRRLSQTGERAVGPLSARLAARDGRPGRVHALWALDAIGTPPARAAIGRAIADTDPAVRAQAARSAGIRRDRPALPALAARLRDPEPAVRREAATALGLLGDPAAGLALLVALGDRDRFVAWSVRDAIRRIGAWDEAALAAALVDPVRGESARLLADRSWSPAAVRAIDAALTSGSLDPAGRARLVGTLGGLYRQEPEWSGRWFGTNPLAGAFPEPTKDWDPEAMAVVLRGLARSLGDPEPAVRREAVAALAAAGPAAAPALRVHLGREPDPIALTAAATGLGALADEGSAAALAALAQDARRPVEPRAAALDALGGLKGREAAAARFAVAFDPEAPAALVARAVAALGREAGLPPNDLAGFLEHREPLVRAAGLLAVAAWPIGRIPPEVRRAVVDRLADAEPEPRRAAIEAAARLRLPEAVPALVALARGDANRAEATLGLAAMPDPAAVGIYLDALADRDPRVRRAAEHALAAIREQVRPELEARAGSDDLEPAAAEGLARVLARFRPVVAWRVIGPFARTTAQVFVGEPTIDFEKSHSGVEGRPIAWAGRKADAKTGRVLLEDFKAGAGDRGGFGYDTNGSPDLAAFAYAEVESDADRPALIRVGSSGSLLVTVNEVPVYTYTNFAGRAYALDGDVARVDLKAGTNRLLVRSRQGVGVWSFGVQISEPDPAAASLLARRSTAEDLRRFALANPGDPARGEALFFDARGIGCARCHAAGGRGEADLGPDLSGLALKFDRAEIVRSVLEPSSRIATGYQPTILALADGRVVSGVVRSEDATHVELADSEARVARYALAEVEDRRVGEVSTMPEGLVDTLTPPEFADLVAFLEGLKATAGAGP